MTDRFNFALNALNRMKKYSGSTTDEIFIKNFIGHSDAIEEALKLATESEQLRYDLEFVWKCVERAKWNQKIFGNPETAIENMVLYPNAPWNNKERWNWDTSHKNYDADIKNYVAENEQLRKERDELAEEVKQLEKQLESWQYAAQESGL